MTHLNKVAILPKDYDCCSKLDNESRRERLDNAFVLTFKFYRLTALSKAKGEFARWSQLKKDVVATQSAKDVVIKAKPEAD